jgi:hypothetical protein
MLSSGKMTIDQEGVTDQSANSGLAFASFFLALIGLLAIVAPSFALVCLVAALLGLFVLLFAKSWDLSSLSINLAKLSIYMGFFSGLAGTAYYLHRENLLDSQAMKIAHQYVQALANGDRNLAIAMNGLPRVVNDGDSSEISLSPEQTAVRNFLNDPTIRMVLEQGLESKWKPNGIRSKNRIGNSIEFEVRLFDESTTNPRPMIVEVRTTLPGTYDSEKKRKWAVDRMYLAPM